MLYCVEKYFDILVGCRNLYLYVQNIGAICSRGMDRLMEKDLLSGIVGVKE